MDSKCRCKMRMSGLSKVEMSGFMGGRGPHGNGAYGFESTRTGPLESIARSRAGAFDADCGGTADRDNRTPGASAAAAHPGASRPCSDSRIAGTPIESQTGARFEQKDLARISQSHADFR